MFGRSETLLNILWRVEDCKVDEAMLAVLWQAIEGLFGEGFFFSS